ncbi:fungal-specific transcription factor domain-containing protein [Aspergillus spectabilis]
MPKSSKPAAPEFRACTECRKRKSKCSGTAPCQNLDEAERRCAKLVEVLQRLNPAIDIEYALTGRGTPTDTGPVPSFERYQSIDSTPECPEGLGERDDFEWNEATSASASRRRQGCADGMASLPTEKAESGYLGTSSGSTLLKTIPAILPESTGSGVAEQDHDLPTNAHQLETPALSEHINNSVVLDGLIDAYFMYYHSSYPILHESTFRQMYSTRREVRVHTSWHPIFYLVLAVGEWLRGVESGSERSKYYNAARSRMSMRMLESGNLLTVQAFLLMGNYLQKRDRPNTGYNFVGIAYRMALGLGLHRDPPTETMTGTLLNERRRVVWWIIYCFDSGFSLTTGRPIMASDSFIDTRLPRNIDDSECDLTSILPAPTNQPTIYSAIIGQARLATIGNTIYRDVISTHIQAGVGLRASRSLDHQLKAWKLSLPIYFTAQDIPTWFRGPRAIIGWKEQNLRMMLWWGSQRLCSTSRHTALTTQNTIHAGIAWYATYFLFQAVIVLSIHQFKPRNPLELSLVGADQDLWVFSITKARDSLTQLGQTNTAGTRCLEVLDRIWQ